MKQKNVIFGGRVKTYSDHSYIFRGQDLLTPRIYTLLFFSPYYSSFLPSSSRRHGEDLRKMICWSNWTVTCSTVFRARNTCSCRGRKGCKGGGPQASEKNYLNIHVYLLNSSVITVLCTAMGRYRNLAESRKSH